MAAIGYHFSAKVISRSRGQSAVAAAAYRIRGRLEDERYGKTHDYSKHEGIEFVWHSAPKNAPGWAHDIGQVWNAVEIAEKRSNSTLAREYVAAFPHQLNAEQREWMLKDFGREELTRKRLIVTAAIHAPSRDGDERNYHAHIMFSDRPIDENGFAKHKDRSFTFDQKGDVLEHGREKWAALAARQLERAGYAVEAERWRHGHEKLGQQATAAEARGDHEYADLLRFAEAGKHLGVVATEIERDGRESHRGNENREIETGNAARLELGKELQAINREIAQLERVAAVTITPAAQEATAREKAEPEPEPLREAAAVVGEAVREMQDVISPVLETASAALDTVADGIEAVIDTADNAASKGAEVIGRMGAVIANGLESFFFGGASRQAPGGAEYQQPTAAPIRQPEPVKSEGQKAKDSLRTVSPEEAAQDPQVQAVITSDQRQARVDLYEKIRREKEQEIREREERERNDDGGRSRER